jgi:PAS domain S-box-containing protein
MIAVLVGSNIAWMAAALSALSGEELVHYGFSIWAASVIAVVIFIARRKAVLHSEELLLEAQREAELRRQAEEAGEKLSERLSLAISASKGAWWFLSFDSTSPEEIPDEIELDPALKAFIGFEDHEMPNSRAAWKERVVPEDREANHQASLAHLRGETALHETKYRIRHKDGSIRWIYSCGRIERDGEGLPVGASGIAWDVTERVESESRLRRLSRAVEQSSSLILITDTAGKIEYVNPKFTRVTGYSLEEAVGNTPALLKSGHTPAGTYKELWETVKAGNEWQGEFQNLKKNGEPHWVIASISPIRDGNGKITHFVGVQEDITERRRVESQLVQAQKMEGIGQLVSGVAHDFNNLLTGIVGFADLSLGMIAEDDPLRVNLQQISKAGESAMSLTRQLLTFSRQQPLPPRIIDLNEVIVGFEKLLRRTISEDVELVTNLAPNPEFVNADPSQVEQILVNLAVNARDAMPGGGRLTVETADVDLEETSLSEELDLAPGRYVTLTVADTGRGMDEATSQRVFEPFFTTKSRGRGTGLGLSTVYGIVKQGVGHIEVDSTPGEGTSFRVFLPLADDPVIVAEQGEQHEVVRTGNERVLLVEDDALVRTFAVKLLKQSGYRVSEAESATRALDIGRDQPFDLLITDVVMPGMNGVELADRLTVERPEMKVLFLSGYADHEIIEKRVLESDATFLAKPFAVDEFVRAVRGLLDR